MEQPTRNRIFCSFGDESNLNYVLLYISTTFVLLNNKVFLYTTDIPGQYILTYTSQLTKPNTNFNIKNSITVHRKAPTNTFFTINSLNYILDAINNGSNIRTHDVDWNRYTDSLLMIDYDQLIKIPLTYIETRTVN